MLRFTAFISFPAMLGLSLIAPELIILTITDKWLPSAFILQLLCIGGAFIPITNLYSNLVISKGKSDIYMWNTISLGIIQLTTMLLLYPYGVHTMIIVYVLSLIHILSPFVQRKKVLLHKRWWTAIIPVSYTHLHVRPTMCYRQ